MAKKSKSDDRRERLEQLERERKAAERKRTLMFAGVVGLVAAIIIGATAWSLISENRRQAQISDRNLEEFGVAASEAGCDEPAEVDAQGSGEHVPEGAIPYDAAPPASGPHRPNWVTLARPFYTADDRPEVPLLVHNLEHGYTVLWYDETIADDDQALQELEDLSSKFSDDTLETAFIAAPWTSDDGGDFPDGQHIAFTHWSADEGGIWQYCSEPSGEALEAFMKDYPYYDAPEPIGGYQGQ